MSDTFDMAADFIYAIEARPYDKSLAAEIDVFLATRPLFFDANDAAAPNRIYRGWLAKSLSVERSIINGALVGGNALPSLGAIVLDVGDEFAAMRAKWRADLCWSGRSVRVIRGRAGQPRNEWIVLFEGYFSAEPGFAKMRVTMPIADFRARLNKPFRDETFPGTGGMDGGADLKGQYKQDAVGVVRGVEGQWLDRANGWVHYCASGFDTILKVSDGGYATGLTEVFSEPPGATEYYVDYANGRIRWGSPPSLCYRVDFISGFAGGATLPGTLAKEICLRAGYDAGQIDDDAADQVDDERPYDVGWLAPDGLSCQDLLDAILGGLLCFYTGTNAAKISFGAVNPPQATAKTDASVVLILNDRNIVESTLAQLPFDPPPKRIDLQYRRNWRVLSETEIAAAAADDDKNFARAEWRIEPAENATTATRYPLSRGMPLPSPIDDATDAAAFKVTAKDLLTVPRPAIEAIAAIAPFGVQIGGEVWIESAINELTGAAVIAKTAENDGEHQVRITGWGFKDAA